MAFIQGLIESIASLFKSITEFVININPNLDMGYAILFSLILIGTYFLLKKIGEMKLIKATIFIGILIFLIFAFA